MIGTKLQLISFSIASIETALVALVFADNYGTYKSNIRFLPYPRTAGVFPVHDVERM
jgi:hypothetical protein